MKLKQKQKTLSNFSPPIKPEKNLNKKKMKSFNLLNTKQKKNILHNFITEFEDFYLKEKNADQK